MLFRVLVLLFIWINLNDSYRAVLHIADASITEMMDGVCALLLYNNNKFFKFESNGFLIYSVEIEKDENTDLYIVSSQCISIKLHKLLILNEEYTMNSYCGSICCWFDVYRNASLPCSDELNYLNTVRLRSLLSSNATNNDDDDDNNDIKDNETFLGRRFYGLPILIYFALLFGVVCLVWICCIIALCVGYSKRRKAIKARGANIRRKQLRKTETETETETEAEADTHHKSKVINSVSPTANSRSIKVVQNNRVATKRSPRPNVILPSPPQRQKERKDATIIHTKHTAKEIDVVVQPPMVHITPSNSSSDSTKLMNTDTPIKGMVLPTSTKLLAPQRQRGRRGERQRQRQRQRQGLQQLQPHEMSSTQKSYPSDNDIIQQMEQDWASENGTNIFDSPISGIAQLAASAHSLHLINSQFNSADTNKNVPIIYAKNFYEGIDVISDEESKQRSHNIYNRENYNYGKRPHTTRPHPYTQYNEPNQPNQPNQPNEPHQPHQPHQPNEYHYHDSDASTSRKSRRTQSDTSMYSKSSSMRISQGYYRTNNSKNPFHYHYPHYPHYPHNMSLEQQIEMKQIIEIDYGQYSEPISLPTHHDRNINHKQLSKDDSVRFPNESMPFNEEKETEKGTEKEKGIQITIQKAPYIDYEDQLSQSTKSSNRRSKKGLRIDKQASLQEPTAQGPLSPISNTPQPISAPLSPKALSNTMPIRPLSQAKKSPFHLPPSSISLQHIHSPEPPITTKTPHSISRSTSSSSSSSPSPFKSKSKSKSESEFESKSKSKSKSKSESESKSESKSKSTHSRSKPKENKHEILHHYSLDQTDLFQKLAKIEHVEDEDITDSTE